MIKWKKTTRGFAIGSFTDLYGHKCSIQESGLMGDDAIGVSSVLSDHEYQAPGHRWLQ